MESKKALRKFVNQEDAINLLPEGETVHTFLNSGMCLVGADWGREELIAKIRSVGYREITGSMARSMNHGLALWSAGDKRGDVLFVETDMDKLNKLDPEEDDEE